MKSKKVKVMVLERYNYVTECKIYVYRSKVKQGNELKLFKTCY